MAIVLTAQKAVDPLDNLITVTNTRTFTTKMTASAIRNHIKDLEEELAEWKKIPLPEEK